MISEDSLIVLLISIHSFMQKFKGRVAGVKVKAVDTTGAGDAFTGGILYSLASDISLYQVSREESLICLVLYCDTAQSAICSVCSSSMCTSSRCR